MGNNQPKCIELGPDVYEIHRTMGQGAFGRVMCVINKSNGHMLAMKVLSKEKMAEQSSNCIKAMIAERKILSEVDSPYVINLHCAVQSELDCYMLLDFASGGDLYYHIRTKKKFSKGVIRFWMTGVLLGLNYLHSNGIVHRDIKPDNVMLNQNGFPLLTDFNVATRLDANGRCSGLCGTDAYIAPEMYKKNSSYGPEVDVWSFGVMMFECFRRQTPWGPRGEKSTKTWMGHKTTCVTMPEGESVKKTIKTKEITYDGKYFPEKVAEVLQKILVVDVKRSTAAGLLEDPWFIEGSEYSKTTPPFVPEMKPNVDQTLAMEDNFKTKERRTKVTDEDQKLFADWDYIPERYRVPVDSSKKKKKKKRTDRLIATSNTANYSSGDDR
eukprot:CAMPEP_0119127818 /NCGR_PEP_ID=MMETSP1310-20130426/6215_1 /TAXON_ID=464262 /ORGANISM="Genus nov. species nov., Strain RCC2339" /LENGTH=381 /DNA_ID=CAMNT_0007118101 /DNA_START=258 /DNA_END=1403 /DNA_ORIENTATION=-